VPLFDTTVITPGGKSPFTIVKKGSGHKIREITYDGRTLDGFFISHHELMKGKPLVITAK
jgi:putative alpha-1,2-mannosidase